MPHTTIIEVFFLSENLSHTLIFFNTKILAITKQIKKRHPKAIIYNVVKHTEPL
jgi:hypothetical protein